MAISNLQYGYSVPNTFVFWSNPNPIGDDVVYFDPTPYYNLRSSDFEPNYVVQDVSQFNAAGDINIITSVANRNYYIKVHDTVNDVWLETVITTAPSIPPSPTVTIERINDYNGEPFFYNKINVEYPITYEGNDAIAENISFVSSANGGTQQLLSIYPDESDWLVSGVTMYANYGDTNDPESLNPQNDFTYYVGLNNGVGGGTSTVIEYGKMFKAPTGVTAAYLGNGNMRIDWVINDDPNDSFITQEVYIKDNTNSGTFVRAASVYPNATTATVRVVEGNSYDIYVTGRVRVFTVNESFPSETITKLAREIPSLCPCSIGTTIDPSKDLYCYYDSAAYSQLLTLTYATCGSLDGSIELYDEDLLTIYDIYLYNKDGLVSQFDSSLIIDNLPSDFYTIKAVTKTGYEYKYGKGCYVLYIPLLTQGSSMRLLRVDKKPIICGAFDKSAGKIVWRFEDEFPATYTYYVYKKNPNPEIQFTDFDLVLTKTGSVKDFALVNTLVEDGYYVYIQNETYECVLLLGADTTGSKDVRTIGGIRKLFISEFDDTVGYNYWKTNDEDYFKSAPGQSVCGGKLRGFNPNAS